MSTTDQQQPAFAPPAGTIFEYGMDGLGMRPATYRLTSWLRPKRPRLTALDMAMTGALPDEFGGADELFIDELLEELTPEPRTGREQLEHCLPEWATHVAGSGVCGCIAPLGEIRVLRMVAWSPEEITRADERARRLAARCEL